MGSLRIIKAVKIVVLAVILLAGAIMVTSIQIQKSPNPLIYQTLLSYAKITSNQALSPKTEIWGNTTISNTSIYRDIEIILYGNLIITNGGSLTLTNVTLKIACASEGEHRIEVQSGGALYINDTDGNPETSDDATIITYYYNNHVHYYPFLFWVNSGSTFQMNNSELHHCGRNILGDLKLNGLWINTNNTIIENNTLIDNWYGIILYYSHHNIIRNNKVTNNRDGFHLINSSYNTFSGNRVTNNYYGFHLVNSSYNTFSDNIVSHHLLHGFHLHPSSYNTLSGNTLSYNHIGIYLYDAHHNIVINNNSSNSDYGFHLAFSTLNNFSGNTAVSNGRGFCQRSGSNNILHSNEAINSTIEGFDIVGVGNDLTGSIVANYLRVRILDHNGNPIQGADVKIENNGYPIYASPGFGGSNSTTDQNGLIERIIVPHQTNINGSWMVDTTIVTVSFFELTIPNNQRVVNMSSSCVITFVVEIVDTYISTNIGAGLNQYLNISAQMDIEIILNLTAPIKLSIIKIRENLGGSQPSGLTFLGRFISIEVNDTTAIQGIIITIHYTDQEVSRINLNETTLTMWFWNEFLGYWVELPSTVDTENDIISAYTDHLTHFAILGTPISPETPITSIPTYFPFLLSFLLTPNGLNPLVYLVMSSVAVAFLAVAGLGLKRRREEEVSGREMVLVRQTPTPWKPKREMAPVRQTPVTIRPRCVYCSRELSENANFCPLCGKAIAICSVCNRDILFGEVFVECPYCHVPSHIDHLSEWIKVKGYCPNCKERLTRMDVI
nr:right-handed parallel beta-helix repeat-containing protein [Candidatus Freyarchaeota archaeon]